MEPHRPNPDELLQKIKEEDARQQRAKLKIFFGMAPGVGKTYTMLKVARELREEGVEIVIGVVETHGRAETKALAEGFETLPKKRSKRIPILIGVLALFSLTGFLGIRHWLHTR